MAQQITGITRVVRSPNFGANSRNLGLTDRSLGNNLIKYTELIDGPKETDTPEMQSATKIVEVDWSFRHEFKVTMLGYTGINANSLSRIPPQSYSLEYPWLYCTGCDMLMGRTNPRSYILSPYPGDTPHPAATGDNGDLTFDVARYQLTFQSLKYRVFPDIILANNPNGELSRWFEREIHHSADNIPVPSGSFRWVTAPNNAIQEGGVPLVFATRQLTYVWVDVPENAMPVVRYRISQCLGRVNTTAFDTISGVNGRLGYPAGTLLMIGADEEPTGRMDTFRFGVPPLKYRVKFTFLYRNNGDDGAGTYYGWNFLFRGYSYTPAFQLVRAPLAIDGSGAPTGPTIYRSANFGLLTNVNPAGLPV